jgi:hypothetical protein
MAVNQSEDYHFTQTQNLPQTLLVVGERVRYHQEFLARSLCLRVLFKPTCVPLPLCTSLYLYCSQRRIAFNSLSHVMGEMSPEPRALLPRPPNRCNPSAAIRGPGRR